MEQNKKNNTIYHNIEILTNTLGYNKIRNTKVFQKDNSFILSPAISEGNNKYWFDISKINLERMNKDFLLLVRIVPDLFILEKSETIQPLLSPNLMGNGARADIWGITFDIDSPKDNSVELVSHGDSSEKVTVELLNKTDLIAKYNAIEGNKGDDREVAEVREENKALRLTEEEREYIKESGKDNKKSVYTFF